jgi:hypothetical protein
MTMTQIVLKPVPAKIVSLGSVTRAESFNQCVCQVDFKGGGSYFYTLTKISHQSWILANVAYFGCYNALDNDSNAQIWPTPETAIRDFLYHSPDQKSVYLFSSAAELIQYISTKKGN